jgi:hypothetical protein
MIALFYEKNQKLFVEAFGFMVGKTEGQKCLGERGNYE